jgi:hypothetical protein
MKFLIKILMWLKILNAINTLKSGWDYNLMLTKFITTIKLFKIVSALI